MFHFDLAQVKVKIETIENEMAREDFWDNPETSQAEMKALKGFKDKVSAYEQLVEAYDDVETMMRIAEEEDDESLIGEITTMAETFLKNTTPCAYRRYYQVHMTKIMGLYRYMQVQVEQNLVIG